MCKGRAWLDLREGTRKLPEVDAGCCEMASICRIYKLLLAVLVGGFRLNEPGEPFLLLSRLTARQQVNIQKILL